MNETPQELPHNDEAEQALLGAILVNNDTRERVASFLKPDHFYQPLHGRIFEACRALIESGKRATPITLKMQFLAEDPVGELSATHYLGRLAASATTALVAKDMGELVCDLATRRKISNSAMRWLRAPMSRVSTNRQTRC